MAADMLLATQQAAWAAQSAAEAAWWGIVPNVAAAVLTAAAALGAVVTWSRSIHDRRRREAALIFALMQPTTMASHVIAQCLKASVAKVDVQATYWAALSSRSLDQQIDLLRHFRLVELPTRAVVDYYAASIAGIEGAKQAIENALSVEPFNDEPLVAAMTEYLRQMNDINSGLEVQAAAVMRGRQ